MGGQNTKEKTSPKNTNKASAMDVKIGERNSIPFKAQFNSFFPWLIGMVISVAPLVVVHYGEHLINGKDFFLELFCDAEVFFICVSMLVAAVCELNGRRRKRTVLNGTMLGCIVLFALMYSQFVDVMLLSPSARMSLSRVTHAALCITLFLGGITYFSKRR